MDSIVLAGELQKALVVPTPMDARPALAGLLRGAKRVTLRYEWIKDWIRFDAIVQLSGWELNDHTEHVVLWRMNE